MSHARLRRADPGPPIFSDTDELPKLKKATPALAALLCGRSFAGGSVPVTERPVAIPAPLPSYDNGPSDRRALHKAASQKARRARVDYGNALRSTIRPAPPFDHFEIIDLTDTTCRWPVTADAPFLFCGRVKPNDEAIPYCGECSMIAYRRPQCL